MQLSTSEISELIKLNDKDFAYKINNKFTIIL